MKFIKSFTVASCSLGLLTLTGCGGGGSSTGTVNDVAPFFVAGNTVTANGVSTEAQFTSGDTPPETSIDTGSTATISFDSNGAVVSLAIDTPDTHLDWSSNEIKELNNIIGTQDSDKISRGWFINPRGIYDYQTYGIWIHSPGASSTTTGAISVGYQTPGDSIPTTGSANFTGGTYGLHVDDSGKQYIVTSNLSVGADFSSRTLSLNTTDSSKFDLENAGVQIGASELNLTGSLAYDQNINEFSGVVSTVSTANTLSGESVGMFYGPNAEELGGAFSLTTSGIETYSGSYGAKQQ